MLYLSSHIYYQASKLFDGYSQGDFNDETESSQSLKGDCGQFDDESEFDLVSYSVPHVLLTYKSSYTYS